MKRILPLVIALALSADAWARVGGGESFGTGRSRSGGGYSGGGGGGDGDLIGLLIWLLFRHPTIGIPVLIVVAAFWMWQRSQASSGGWIVDGAHQRRHLPSQHAAPRRSRASLDVVAARDPGFSQPVLYDYLQLVHRRAVAAAPTGAWESLAPFVAPEAREQLQRMSSDVRSVDDVVLGGILLEEAAVEGAWQRIVVRFLESRVETIASGQRRVYLEERWTLRRAAGAVSLAPDAVRRMGCPSCGAAIETDPMGRCKVCGTVITDGRLQWTVASVVLVEPRRPIPAPELSLGPGGFEDSARADTVVDPRLGSQTRAFLGRHPDFSFPDFEKWVREVFLQLQGAWSRNQWEQARPHTTDPMFQSLRFWMDRYAAAGLRNALDDVRVDRVQVVKVGLDAWYETLTVRIWGAMKDYTVDASGRVVGGNPRVERVFSEYWTFVRSAGTGGAAKDPHRCPSCGAALDKVNQAGVCGYCDSKITTGDFDWVLSRIDQPQVYGG